MFFFFASVPLFIFLRRMWDALEVLTRGSCKHEIKRIEDLYTTSLQQFKQTQRKDLAICLEDFEMASSLQNFGDDSVLLNVTHSNLKHHFNELRFNLHSTVSAAKERLWKNCGTAIDSMSLQLFDDNDRKVCDMNDDSRLLGFYCPRDGYRIHIVDLDPSSVTAGGWMEDTSLVEKYSISEDAYSKLDGTFRKFKEKLISQDPSLNQPKITDDYMEDLARNIQVGDRCEVDPGGKRGVVMFVERAETLAPGFWVGVQYDEPVGKHDGMVKGKRYFSCPPLHGVMLRPEKVKVGDYPERDPFEEEEI